MADLIDRQAAINAVLGACKDTATTECAVRELEELPPAQPNLRPTCDQLAIDCISRQAAIDAILGVTIFDSERSLREYTQKTGSDKWCEGVIEAMDAVTEVPSVQPDLAQLLAYECGKASAQPDKDKQELIRAITAGIVATNTKDVYSCGIRNGMRWCRGLLEEDAPKFEEASLYAQPEIIRCKDCRYYKLSNLPSMGMPIRICEYWKQEDVDDDDFCSRAERQRGEAMDDLISRKAVIDRINKQREHLRPDKFPQDKIGDAAYRICAEFIELLPSASSEIIRCKDCKHWDTTWQNDFAPNYHYCPLIDGTHRDDFYCADAERRTDETQNP